MTALLRRLRRWLAIAAGASLVAACGGGSDPPATSPSPSPTPATAPGAEVKWVSDYMRDWYLWAAQIADRDVGDTSSAEQALEALRLRPIDRYSYVDSRDRYTAFFDEGRSVGFGIVYTIDGDTVRLRLVQPSSPAAAAGLRRGDVVDAVDGTPVATLIAQNAFAAALGPSEAGYVGRLSIRRGAESFEAAITKDWYDVRYVLAARVLSEVDPQIGYVHLYGMAEPTRDEWQRALAPLAAAGVRRLVVDLRDNGGGRLNVAADIGSTLAPDASAGAVLIALGFNERYRSANFAIRLGPSAYPAFDEVVWITSGASCSAAEMLINGLAPLRPSAIVGEKTCGKPVGFTPSVFGAKVLSAVTFTGANRDGNADFFDGLTPTCRISAEPYLAYGDPADPKLAEAIHRLRTGRCSDLAEPPADAVARKAAPRWPYEHEQGLARETGLR